MPHFRYGQVLQTVPATEEEQSRGVMKLGGVAAKSRAMRPTESDGVRVQPAAPVAQARVEQTPDWPQLDSSAPLELTLGAAHDLVGQAEVVAAQRKEENVAL